MPQIQTRTHERSCESIDLLREFKPKNVKRIRQAPANFKGKYQGKDFSEWIRAVMRAEIKRRRWRLDVPIEQATRMKFTCPKHRTELTLLDERGVGGKRLHYECCTCWDEAIAYQYKKRTWWVDRFTSSMVRYIG